MRLRSRLKVHSPVAVRFSEEVWEGITSEANTMGIPEYEMVRVLVFEALQARRQREVLKLQPPMVLDFGE